MDMQILERVLSYYVKNVHKMSICEFTSLMYYISGYKPELPVSEAIELIEFIFSNHNQY